MNNTFFSFKRFWLLLRNDLIINYKTYLLTIVGTFIVMYLILYMNMPKESQYIHLSKGSWGDTFYFDNHRYEEIFMMTLFALAGFIGMAFHMLDNKVKTSNYLLTPASSFEKYNIQLCIRVIAGLGLFLLIFWIDAGLARFTALSGYKGESTHAIMSFKYSMFYEQMPTKELLIMVSTLFSLGIYLFSFRISFKKYGLIKTIISMPILFLIITGIMIFASHLFFPTQTTGLDIYWEGVNATIDRAQTNNLDLIAVNLIWIVLLPLGYYKLKEKQL